MSSKLLISTLAESLYCFGEDLAKLGGKIHQKMETNPRKLVNKTPFDEWINLATAGMVTSIFYHRYTIYWAIFIFIVLPLLLLVLLQKSVVSGVRI